MSFGITHRYGYQDNVDKIDEATAKELVDELIEEQFSKPDLEHQQVAITHTDGTFFTVFKAGYAQIEPADFSDRRRWYKPFDSVDAILEDIQGFAEKSQEMTQEGGWVSERQALKLPKKSPLF